MRSISYAFIKATLFVSLISQSAGAEVSQSAATVPEPSVAVLGGICGLLFLIWRKK